MQWTKHNKKGEEKLSVDCFLFTQKFPQKIYQILGEVNALNSSFSELIYKQFTQCWQKSAD